MRKLAITISLAFFYLLNTGTLKAQDKILEAEKYKHTPADSMLTQFYNKVYNCFYTPAYWRTKTSTYTLLKIDIDKDGLVTAIKFSDSADPDFLRAFSSRSALPDENATLARYARAMSYKSTSLMIPVSFEPDYPNQKKNISYDELENITKFNGKSVEGSVQYLRPMYIRVSNRGNM